MTEDLTFVFDVGWTDRRPVVPEQCVSRVVVVESTLARATCTAALMVMRPASAVLGLREVQMPTSTRLVRVEA